jgi:hypothetical protein
VSEPETTVPASALQPGDRIHYAGIWHAVRAVTTVTTVHAAGLRLDYEPGQELPVRRPEPAPAEETSTEGAERA